MIATVVAAEPAFAAGCYNLSRGEPRELTGTLDYIIFAGPPNYEDVQQGDMPEPSYVLQLARPICITGDDYADPHHQFRSVQVSEAKAFSGQLRRFLHRTVTLTLTGQMSAETGHHHEPLVARVTAAQLAGPKPLTMTDEYGTPATTIRAFYAALGEGQGSAASALVVPEKRATNTFSSSALTEFYGNLPQHIRLVDIARNDESSYVVHYRYGTQARACDARAVVTTTVRGGRNYIQGIKAMDNC